MWTNLYLKVIYKYDYRQDLLKLNEQDVVKAIVFNNYLLKKL